MWPKNEKRGILTMAKWSYLARAYVIKEYAYLRQTEVENLNARTDEQANSLDAVINDIKTVLEMAEDNDDAATIKQCKKFLKDFDK